MASNTSIAREFYSEEMLNWLTLILEERFGHVFILSQEQNSLKLSLVNASQCCILFPRLESVFHESRSDLPCSQWEAEVEGWQSVLKKPLPAPCVYELNYPLIENKQDHAVIHYDILGLTYWMLNRIEEIGRTDLDNHQRFPAVNSHAYKHNYLERPVVDEWLHILGQVIQRVWPGLELKQHEFSMKVSHDVDSPSLYAFKSWKTIIRMMAGHLLKRRDLKATLQAPWLKLTGGKNIPKQDPFNTFDWLMDVSEANNLTSAFYFICGRTDPVFDADYEPEHNIIRGLMRRIHQRGHEIGLHPSYATFQKAGLIKQEAERLKRICAEEGIVQDLWGGRMHYLRWEQPTTLRAWDRAGMSYESTLGYADRPGFRCGSCFEYPAFDPVTLELLNLRVRPLIVMECSVFDSAYLGLGMTTVAEDKILLLKDRCRKVTGSFNMLWHNSYFMVPEVKNMYERLIFASR
jgi:hypothetical protein